MKIGIFGGTFDPCHCGHYEIVRTVLKENLVDKVIVVPTIVDYYRKDKKRLFNYDERFVILHKWFKNLDNVKVDNIEYNVFVNSNNARKACEHEMPVSSRRYWHMLCDLKKKYGPENEYYSIIGEDSWINLGTWYNSEQLIKESKFIVVERDEKINRVYDGSNAKFITIDKKFSKISATEIREGLIKDGAWTKDIYDEPDYLGMYLNDVGDYLMTNKTYDEILEPNTELEETEKKIKNFATSLNEKAQEDKNEEKDKDCHFKYSKYSDLEYESLRDKALEMQYVLKNIEKELHECAMCGGKSENSYSYEDCHAKLCQIMFGSVGYYKETL